MFLQYLSIVPDITDADYRQLLDKKSTKYLQVISKLEPLNPLLTLKRGYAITKTDNKVINSCKKAKKGQILEVQFYDGEIKAKVI